MCQRPVPLSPLHLQVATTLYVDFDMRQEKITSTVTFQQIKLLSRPEFNVVLAWAVAAIFLSFLSLALAMPAAIQVRPALVIPTMYTL